jgi:hypothetical protein
LIGVEELSQAIRDFCNRFIKWFLLGKVGKRWSRQTAKHNSSGYLHGSIILP